MAHNVSTRDGRVTADERERLAVLHGAEGAAAIIAEVEAQFHPAPAPAARKATKAARSEGAADPIPDSESEE